MFVDIVVFSIVAVVCMKVLVSGSLRGLNESQKEPLRTAAKELGAALAAAGHTLLVGSEDTDDVDPFVVDGFLSVENASGVEVHLMRGAARCYQGKTNVTNTLHRYLDWDVTVLEVVRKYADAVVVIAGRRGVVQAGIAGWMLGRPTIPFGGFGGGAETVWEYGSSDRQQFFFGALTDVEVDQLNSSWEPGTTGPRLVQYLDRCAEAARRLAVSPRLRIGVSVGMLIALIAWVAFLALPLLGWPPPPTPTADGSAPVFESSKGVRFLLLLAAVCSAGAFGALVQSMRGLRGGITVTGPKASIEVVLGVAAGFLTAALYMLAEIAITGKLELPNTNADYSRVALVVSMAAVFASLYLDAAFSRFDGVKESVMAGAYGKSDKDV